MACNTLLSFAAVLDKPCPYGLDHTAGPGAGTVRIGIPDSASLVNLTPLTLWTHSGLEACSSCEVILPIKPADPLRQSGKRRGMEALPV